jgi:hypothetical protein
MEDKYLKIKMDLLKGWSWRHEAYDGQAITSGKVFIYKKNVNDTLISASAKNGTLEAATKIIGNILTRNKVPFTSGSLKTKASEFVTIEFSSAIHNRPMKMKYYLIYKNSKTYVFTLVTAEDTYMKALFDCEKMLATLRIS